MNHRIGFVLLPLVATMGLIAATWLSQSAFAYDINNLPAGFVESFTHETGVTICADYYVVSYIPQGSGVGKPGATSPHLCTDSPTFQQDLDAFVNSPCTYPGATCTPPPPTTSTQPTTSTGTSSTPIATTTTDPVGATTTTQLGGQVGQLNDTWVAPVASFTSSAVGLALTFTDTSVADAKLATITWHFGDGTNGTGPVATHTYEKVGSFTILEIVTDTHGLASQASEKIDVSPFNLTRPATHKVTDVLTPRLTAAISKAVSLQTAVFCGRTEKAWENGRPAGAGEGWSIVGSRQSHLWPAGCQTLLTGKGDVPLALLVAGHEAALASGVRSERAADCFGADHAVAIAAALRLPTVGVNVAARAIVKRKWGAAC